MYQLERAHTVEQVYNSKQIHIVHTIKTTTIQVQILAFRVFWDKGPGPSVDQFRSQAKLHVCWIDFFLFQFLLQSISSNMIFPLPELIYIYIYIYILLYTRCAC